MGGPSLKERSMRKLVIGSIVGLSVFAGSAYAAGPQPTAAATPAAATAANPKVEAALKRHYVGYEWKITGHREVYGVGVNDVAIKDKDGESTAAITDEGDMLFAGYPAPKNKIAGPVELVLKDLFKTQPADVDRMRATTYLVLLKASNGGQCQVDFDAVGRVKEIKTLHDLKGKVEVLEGHEIKDEATTKRMESFVDRNFGKEAKVDAIHAVPTLENFYNLEVTESDGRKMQVVTDGNNLFSTKHEIKQDQLPAAVSKTLTEMFNTDKVESVFRRTHEFYQIQQPCPNGETMAMQINITGEVTRVNLKGGAGEEAVTASHRQ
jgi:hypothetical protein